MATRVLAAVLGIAFLLVAAVLVVDRPVDVGQVDLSSPTTSGSRVAGATPDPTAASGPTANPDPTATPGPTAEPSPPRRLATARQGPAPTPSTAPTAVRDVPVHDARLADQAPPTVHVPDRLRLPALDLDLPVVAVGVDDDGQMEVPEDVGDAGWYRHGPTPGDPGNAVIAGHVDSRVQGLGAFHRLVDLQVGDRVEVTSDDGTTTWVVAGRRLVDKAALDPSALFRRSGQPRLVLVTCGGDFDGSVRSYRSNVVVVAHPV